jgi:hypothetical protein
MQTFRLLTLLFISGCAGSGTVSFNEVGKTANADSTSGDGGTNTTEDDAADWTGSSLRVDTPSPGEVLPYGEDSTFTAVVLDAAGAATDFTDLTWTTNASGWTESGADFESSGLDVGTQAISVEAVLPDGTVLKNAVGGVRVQHPDTGTYVGNLAVDISGEFQDFPIAAACIGAAIVTVDLYGETAVGQSTCIVSLLGYSLDAIHDFDFEVEDDEVSGQVSLDLSFFQVDFAVVGDLGGGVISAEWATDYSGIALDGSMELERVTTEVASEG